MSTRPVKATVAAIGGAGIVLSAPAAALLAAPPESAAQSTASLTSLFGPNLGGIAGQVLNPIFTIAGLVPGLNIFIGNGLDGTAANPNGGKAGILAGNGGRGFSTTKPGTKGGNGGA